MMLVLASGCVQHESNQMKKIVVDYGADEMATGCCYHCEYFFLADGKKEKVVCFREEEKDKKEDYLKFIYNETGRISKLVHKKRWLVGDDTITYFKGDKPHCFTSENKEWVMCFDETEKKILSAHRHINDGQPEINSVFKKFKYDSSGNVTFKLTYDGSGVDMLLGKYFYVYTKFDKNNNWVERKAYSHYEWIDEVNINNLSEPEQKALLNTFPTEPVEDDNPDIERREIIYY